MGLAMYSPFREKGMILALFTRLKKRDYSAVKPHSARASVFYFESAIFSCFIRVNDARLYAGSSA